VSSPLRVGLPHHVRLTVTDVARSVAFYTEVLGFEVALDRPPADDPGGVVEDTLQGGVVLTNAGVMVGLRPVAPGRAGDRFDPLRVGLDHLSFGVESRADLDRAVAVLDERGIEHGPVREAPPLGMAFLAVFDPDGIALELTAPL
jgi:catechol 2,3-dioxygenase-like lactoylglutathione lyase family enzyme